jgi:ABC-type bacteriocin/lantibiotic exporter with double-glycine peptidase domain
MFHPIKIFQQKDFGCCGPTTLCSVLDYYGKKVSMSKLIELTKTKATRDGGCEPENLTEAVNLLGGYASYQWDSSFDEIKLELSRDIIPIVSIYDSLHEDEHYINLLGISGSDIYFGDSCFGSVRKIKVEEFLKCWRETDLYPRNRPLRERQIIIVDRA